MSDKYATYIPKNGKPSLYKCFRDFGIKTTYQLWKANRYYKYRPYLFIELIQRVCADPQISMATKQIIVNRYNGLVYSNYFAPANKWILFESESWFHCLLWGLNDFNLISRFRRHFQLKQTMKNPEKFREYIQSISKNMDDTVFSYHEYLYAIWKHYVLNKNPLPFLEIREKVTPSEETKETQS